MQLDDDDDADNDKGAKKSFKHTIQTLEMENKIHLDVDGHVTLIQKKNKKKEIMKINMPFPIASLSELVNSHSLVFFKPLDNSIILNNW